MSEATRKRYLVPMAGGSSTASAERYQRGGPLHGLRVDGCAALRGSLFRSVSCAIYEERPSVCREFVPGSKRCKDSRASLIDRAREVLEATP
jgi:Fe-S-cluster containining protein